MKHPLAVLSLSVLAPVFAAVGLAQADFFSGEAMVSTSPAEPTVRTPISSPVASASPASAPPVGATPSSKMPRVTASTLPVRSGDSPTIEAGAVTPVRVRVPALDLDLDIEPVGVDETGLFDVPHADRVGWYQFGPTPGDDGAAVLAAHVDYNGKVGAFYDLGKLGAGDVVHLDFIDGSSKSFEVVDQVLYDKQALPAAELFRRGGDPVLHLATCGGTFDRDARSYRGNRVVTAVPLDPLSQRSIS